MDSKVHFVVNCRHIFTDPTNCQFIKDMSENHPEIKEVDEKHIIIVLGNNEYTAKRVGKCSYEV